MKRSCFGRADPWRRVMLSMVMVMMVQLAVNVSAAPIERDLPVRELEITGASFTIDTWIDVATFGTTKFPFDDRALIDNPEMAVMCYSPWEKDSKDKNVLFTHIPMLDVPVIWYFPLNYTLGVWKYEMGDNLVCELWECDGNPQGGCSPEKPSILPNASAGDELLGRATLSMGAFQNVATTLLNMTVPADGIGEKGRMAGSLLVECSGCRSLWRDDPSWMTPFMPPSQNALPSPPDEKEEKETKDPSESPPPEDRNSDSIQNIAENEIKENVIPDEQPEEKLTIPPMGPIPPTSTDAPNPNVKTPSVPNDKEEQKTETATDNQDSESKENVDTRSKEAQGKDPQKAEEKEDSSSKNSTKTILVIVLSILGAAVGLLILTAFSCLVWRRCGWKSVSPEMPGSLASPLTRPALSKKNMNQQGTFRVRAEKPQDAAAAMRHYNADEGIAELPWMPNTN